MLLFWDLVLPRSVYTLLPDHIVCSTIADVALPIPVALMQKFLLKAEGVNPTVMEGHSTNNALPRQFPSPLIAFCPVNSTTNSRQVVWPFNLQPSQKYWSPDSLIASSTSSSARSIWTFVIRHTAPLSIPILFMVLTKEVVT